MSAKPPRQLTLRIFRHHPQDPASVPHEDRFTLSETPGLTLFLALQQLREEVDPSLSFDFVCRAGVCGSCAMVINGRPGLACRTQTANLPAEISLHPLPGFALIADLSVDTGRWMRRLSEHLEAWVHGTGPTDVDALEAPMEPALAEAIYELDRCIECGCCIAACGTAQMRPDFLGAVGLNKIARFRLDPQDQRDDTDYYAVVGDDSGIFGCMTLLACQDICPKELPLATQLAHLRRVMARRALTA